MTRVFRRDLAFSAALLLCLALYAFVPSSPVWRAALAVSGLAVVVVHMIGVDEVRRAAAFRAGFTAFVLAAGISVGAAVLGTTEFLSISAGDMWAWLFALYLVSWIGHALIRA